MRIIRDFITGITSYIEAVKIIFSTYIWLAFSIPALLSIGIYYGGDILIDTLGASLKEFDLSAQDQESGAHYLRVGILSFAVYVSKYMTKYLVLGLLAPLLTMISTTVEQQMTGNRYPFNFRYYIQDIRRALNIIVRNMLYQILVMGIFFGITFIYSLPFIVNEIVYFIVAFYFYGFSFMDYTNERRRLSVQDSVRFTRTHVGAAFALGGIYGGIWYIPYAGVVAAPILAVVAGTVVVHRLVDLSKNPYAIRPGETAAGASRDGESLASKEEIEVNVE